MSYGRWSVNAASLSVLSAIFAIGYVALSAWGWGGWRPLLAEPARAGVCLGLILLAAATPLCGCNLSPGRRVEIGNDWIFPPLLLLGLIMGWASAYCDRRSALTIGAAAMRYAGVSVFLIGFVFRLVAMLVLGPRFTVWVAIQNGHTLVTTGLYRYIRHPSYTGAIFTLVGWAMAFRSLIGLVLAGAMSLILLTRISAEERLLVAEFGEEYACYQKRSWRLAPGVY